MVTFLLAPSSVLAELFATQLDGPFKIPACSRMNPGVSTIGQLTITLLPERVIDSWGPNERLNTAPKSVRLMELAKVLEVVP
jgi:hypothetical protein